MGSAIIGLIGVVIGAFLGAGLDEWKSRRERKLNKGALLDELRSNLLMLPQKREIVEHIIEHINQDKLLPGGGARFLNTFYKTYFPSIIPNLNIKERNSFHILYEYFRVIDWVLESYYERIVESIGTERIGNYIGLYSAMMQDILDLLNLTEKLITKHLNGDPEDVLYYENELKGNEAKYSSSNT